MSIRWFSAPFMLRKRMENQLGEFFCASVPEGMVPPLMGEQYGQRYFVQPLAIHTVV